jgi:hypothetical protein
MKPNSSKELNFREAYSQRIGPSQQVSDALLDWLARVDTERAEQLISELMTPEGGKDMQAQVE